MLQDSVDGGVGVGGGEEPIDAAHNRSQAKDGTHNGI